MAKKQTQTESPEQTDAAKTARVYRDTPEPTMVNGQYVGEAAKPKRELNLFERIAGAFSNQRQIEVVAEVAQLAGGRSTAESGEYADEVDAQINELSNRIGLIGEQLDKLLEANLALGERLTKLEAEAAERAAAKTE